MGQSKKGAAARTSDWGASQRRVGGRYLLLGGLWVFREPPVPKGFSCGEAVVGVVDKETPQEVVCEWVS